MRHGLRASVRRCALSPGALAQGMRAGRWEDAASWHARGHTHRMVVQLKVVEGGAVPGPVDLREWRGHMRRRLCSVLGTLLACAAAPRRTCSPLRAFHERQL